MLTQIISILDEHCLNSPVTMDDGQTPIEYLTSAIEGALDDIEDVVSKWMTTNEN